MASIELTVAYPGREGAHSAAACDRLFPAARLVPLPTFSDVVDAVVGRPRARTASSRSRARSSGPVAETHDLLYESPLSIVAEAILPVNHCLVGPAAWRSSEVREIHSHPVALDQCRKLVASLPNALAVAAPTTGDAASIVAGLADPPSSRSRAIGRPGSTGSRSSTGTSAIIPRRTRGSSPSPRTRASTAATASGGRRSPSRRIIVPERFIMRSSHWPGTESISTCSSRGRFRRGPSATGSTPSSADTRSIPRSPPTLREMRDLTARLRVFGSYRADHEGNLATRNV